MTIITSHSTMTLWQDAVKKAEHECQLILDQDLEFYLISLLIRYTNKPEIANTIFASAFLQALQYNKQAPCLSLQAVGDQCLIYASFFPEASIKKRVNMRYFVDLGRSAYARLSEQANDLHSALSLQFVNLMDILQAINSRQLLLPLQAYEQWQSLGSQRAYQILQSYVQK